MTHLAAVFLSASIILSLLLGTLAGPACARRNWRGASCISECGSKWGFPGNVMGSDPWGVVMKPMSGDMATAVADACGFSTQDQPSSIPSQPPQAVESQVSTSLAVSSPSTSSSTTSSSTVVMSQSHVVSQNHTTSQSHVITETVTPTTTQLSTEKTLPPTTVHTTLTSPTAPLHQPPSDPPSSSGPASGGGSSDINSYLSEHNSVRGQHGAAPLSWSDDLARKAQQWANGCVFKHSGGSLGPFGENLAAGTGPSYDIHAAIKSWTDESSQYNAGNPQPSHFTQVVWKSSNQVGCAFAVCNGIFPAKFGPAKFFVCEYSPQGNVIGEFPQKVQA